MPYRVSLWLLEQTAEDVLETFENLVGAEGVDWKLYEQSRRAVYFYLVDRKTLAKVLLIFDEVDFNHFFSDNIYTDKRVIYTEIDGAKWEECIHCFIV